MGHRRPRYVDDATRRVRRYFADWTDRPAASITRREAIQAIDRVARENGTTSARRGAAYARAMYGWAIKRDALADNPFLKIALPGKEITRDRALDDDGAGGDLARDRHPGPGAVRLRPAAAC